MKAVGLALALAAAAAFGCGSGNGASGGGGLPDARFIDGAVSMPTITSFTATPSQVTSGVATAVKWSWTFEIEPPLPTPTCTIDNGVGPVKRGDTTMVTLTQVTI